MKRKHYYINDIQWKDNIIAVIADLLAEWMYFWGLKYNIF